MRSGTAARDGSPSEDLVPQTILIADNNAFYRQVLGDFFREEGYQVRLAADGVEALEQVASGGVDIIVLDLIMPRIDGARVSRFLKAHPTFARIPIVILSGILADEIEGIETIRADGYVAKMPMEQLREALSRVIGAVLEGRSAPVLEGFEKMYRREVVLELLEERRARDSIQDALTEAVVEIAGDRRILRANRTFEQMAGASAGEMLSRPLEEFFPESRDLIRASFDRLGSAGTDTAGVLLAERGRSLRLRIHSVKDPGGAVAGMEPVLERAAVENPKVRLVGPERLPSYVLLIRDVTEEIQAQQDRERFRELMARAERMSAFGIFVAGAAHELNNPLTGVLGYAQILSGRRELPGDVRDSLRKIEAGAARCRAIVENLLVFSRKGAPERRCEGVNDLVKTATSEWGDRAAERGVEIRIELAPTAGRVEVNGAEFVQAMGAVIDNALLAALDGRAPRRIVVRTYAREGFAVVEVVDSGPGIRPEVLGRIFDPFFTTREVGRGKGLGLSVAYGIVRAHSGTLTARNLPGGGACFAIRLPLASASAEEPGEAAEEEPARNPGRILVVDDEPVVLDLLTDLLAPHYHVETAANGRDGLAKAASGDYDVILLDIRMPDMSGKRVYEALAATRPALADRVVFTTGDVVQEETRSFLEGVANPCLSKPFSIDTVTDLVAQVLSASRRS